MGPVSMVFLHASCSSLQVLKVLSKLHKDICCFRVLLEYIGGSRVKNNAFRRSLTFPLALKIIKIETFWFSGKLFYEWPSRPPNLISLSGFRKDPRPRFWDSTYDDHPGLMVPAWWVIACGSWPGLGHGQWRGTGSRPWAPWDRQPLTPFLKGPGRYICEYSENHPPPPPPCHVTEVPEYSK